MRREYSREFDPPAPVVPVRVTASRSGRGKLIEGKLDTGADICALPDVLIAELAMPPVGTVRAAGYAGELREMVVYRVDIEIDDVSHRRVKALSTRRPHVIIGRNILQKYLLRLDGPRARLELRIAAAR